MNTNITVSKDGYFICVLNVLDGKNRRYTIAPLTPRGEHTDITTEPPEVQAACQKAWTPEVIAAYEAHKAEQL